MPSEPSKALSTPLEPPVRLTGGNLVTRVPVPLSSLVARERECTSVIALLREGKRLVTLTGPGGVGKTRLAIKIATEIAPEFADGAAFIDLSAVSEASVVIPEIARTLGVRRADNQPTLAKLVDLL